MAALRRAVPVHKGNNRRWPRLGPLADGPGGHGSYERDGKRDACAAVGVIECAVESLTAPATITHGRFIPAQWTSTAATTQADLGTDGENGHIVVCGPRKGTSYSWRAANLSHRHRAGPRTRRRVFGRDARRRGAPGCRGTSRETLRRGFEAKTAGTRSKGGAASSTGRPRRWWPRSDNAYAQRRGAGSVHNSRKTRRAKLQPLQLRVSRVTNSQTGASGGGLYPRHALNHVHFGARFAGVNELFGNADTVLDMHHPPSRPLRMVKRFGGNRLRQNQRSRVSFTVAARARCWVYSAPPTRGKPTHGAE